MQTSFTNSESGICIKNLMVKDTVKSIKEDEPTRTNSPLFAYSLLSNNIFHNIFKAKKYQITILNDINVLLNPSEMCLVFGKPKHSNSILLDHIANPNPNNNSSGSIQFSNLSSRNQLVMNDGSDNHYPHLSVEQTLQFALACSKPHLDNTATQQLIDELLQQFEMTHTKTTRVGDNDEFVKGISGGERRRLSLLETLITDASIFALDNATRGLDSSTAFHFIQFLKKLAGQYNKCFMMTLYQGSQSLIDQFDKALVIYNGYQIYFGELSGLEPYFAKLGYVKKNDRVTTMEFIDMILDDAFSRAEKVELLVDSKFVSGSGDDIVSVPFTPEEFHQRWVESEQFEAVRCAIGQFEKTGIFAVPKNLKSVVALGPVKQFTTCFWRNTLNNFKNILYYVVQLISFILMAIFIGTLFLRLDMTTRGSFARGSVIFFWLILFTFVSISEVKKNFGNSLIIRRQSKNYHFYHPSIEAITDLLSDFMFKAVEVFIFVVILYFLVNFNSEAGTFFATYLFVIVFVFTINQLFHIVARCCSRFSLAAAISGLLLLWLSVYGTYVIQYDQMQKWAKLWTVQI
ncbi:unnamed protein product [Ambrosiozyma monospora]|uniref:Unnamed protein product n=1 Tax=Ambrosiozyma monospora TaxID=43982 RepID=A0ACB5T3Z1_AMBMO|nr:unnamed protein product [Ambrosiozyma monospora]